MNRLLYNKLTGCWNVNKELIKHVIVDRWWITPEGNKACFWTHSFQTNEINPEVTEWTSVSRHPDDWWHQLLTEADESLVRSQLSDRMWVWAPPAALQQGSDHFYQRWCGAGWSWDKFCWLIHNDTLISHQNYKKINKAEDHSVKLTVRDWRDAFRVITFFTASQSLYIQFCWK